MNRYQHQPVVISALRKDGTFDVQDGYSSSLRSKKMLFFEKTLYKLQYKCEGIQGFFARGIKEYDNSLLLNVIDDKGKDMLFAFKSEPDSSSDPKILDVDSSKTSSATGLKKCLPDVRQILLTKDCMVFLKSKTSLTGFATSV